MDLLLSMMHQLGVDLYQTDMDDVVEKYTNKKFLIESNHASLQAQENESMSCDYTSIKTTTTPELKSLVTVPLHIKNCIALNDLLKSIDKPITGKFLLCRSICPPIKICALFTIVDDPDGNLGVRISLYNFVRNMSHWRPNDVYQYLPVGTILAIMNPWFKKTADGGLTIRCDNPAEVVILNQSMVKDIFGCLTWKGDIPMKYRRKELLAGDSVFDTNWKASGNEYFAQGRFSDAILAYTNGIDGDNSSGKNKRDLLANRSAAYLALHKYTLALVDAESVLIVDNAHIKCLFRKTKALFGLAQYQNAQIFLSDASIETLPTRDQKIITDLIVKAKSLIVQSQAGKYPWIEIFQNKFDELAEFVGPVIVKKTSTKGRGLFATGAIKAGQLILVSRAFARVVDNLSNNLVRNIAMSLNQKYISDRAQTQLVTEVAHILKESPEKCQEVYNLYAGPEFSSHHEQNVSHGSEIDMKRIAAICFYNNFAKSRFDVGDRKERDCGLWLTPSYINHSCVDANTTWHRNGNFIFVRAFHDIAKNEEILISYTTPLGRNAKEILEKHDFVCDCRLCNRDVQDNSTIQTTRSDLILQLDAILNKYCGDLDNLSIIPWNIEADDYEMTIIMKSLNDLRKDAPELNLSYVDKLELWATVYFRNGQYWKSVTTLEKAYNVVADIPAFCHMAASISNNVVVAYVILGQIDKIKEWIRVLKRNTSLTYGSWKVIEVAFPFTCKSIEQLGLSLNEM